MLKIPIAGLGALLLSAAHADTGDLKHPDWHPDGHLLVSEGSCTGDIGLYVIDTGTGDIRLLFDSERVDGYPRWFPDGRRIAFHQINDEGVSRIHIAELSEGGRVLKTTNVTDGGFDIEPAPSPDGVHLAYSTRGEGGQDIALLNLQTDDITVWKTDYPESFPSWRPDGTAVLFHARQSGDVQIYERALTSSQPTQFSLGPGPNIVGHMSADSAHLYFASERDGDREIYVQQLDDGDVTRLTNRPGRDGYPKISPNGTQVAYHNQSDEEQTVVTVLNFESGKRKRFACSDYSN